MTTPTRTNEDHWRVAHGRQWVQGYIDSTFGPQRYAMSQALKVVAPFKTVLDLGCNCGVLVPWLTSASPGCQITGVDLNREALDEANRCWPTQTWVHGSIVDWLPEQTGTWDVIVSSSCLEHVAPSDMPGVILQLTRLATKAIVLQEVVTTDGREQRTLSIGIAEWRYDYQKRFSALSWKCTAFETITTDQNRPAAVMTFTRS